MNKKNGNTLCISAVALAVMAATSTNLTAQTTLPPQALRPGVAVSVLVCLPPGSNLAGCRLALIDQATLGLDTTGPVPILRALPSPPSPVPINERTIIGKATAGQTTLVLPDAGYIPASLRLHLNGLRQYAPDDYTLAGAVITFRSALGVGDVAVADYRL
jgi:hypothetical protein